MKAIQLVWVLMLTGAVLIKLPAQTIQTLHSFTNPDGLGPSAPLTLGSDGSFYGTTSSGGMLNSVFPTGMGTVFKITKSGNFTLLASFNGGNGATPTAALTLGADGNFYGVTQFGGNTNLNTGYGYGTVFKMTANGAITTLVSFSKTNGAYPNAYLTVGNDGNFYGTTYYGGITNPVGAGDGYGTVFMMTPTGSLTTLVFFNNTNGSWPVAPLTLGNDGNFYGTTGSGGNLSLRGGQGCGTVFKLTTGNIFTALVSFGETNGIYPNGLTLGPDGNFYGTTQDGGLSNAPPYGNGMGTVFKVTTNGILTTVFNFNFADGAFPYATLTLGGDGGLYGTAPNGGNTNSANPYGCGTVFKVTTNGTCTLLASFESTNGATPIGTVVFGNDGKLYGTTRSGGNTNINAGAGGGTVFVLPLFPIVQPTLMLQLWSGTPLITLYGTLGDTYTIESATNLASPNWTPILIVPNLSVSPFQMIDPTGVNQPSRFYRAVQTQ